MRGRQGRGDLRSDHLIAASGHPTTAFGSHHQCANRSRKARRDVAPALPEGLASPRCACRHNLAPAWTGLSHGQREAAAVLQAVDDAGETAAQAGSGWLMPRRTCAFRPVGKSDTAAASRGTGGIGKPPRERPRPCRWAPVSARRRSAVPGCRRRVRRPTVGLRSSAAGRHRRHHRPSPGASRPRGGRQSRAETGGPSRWGCRAGWHEATTPAATANQLLVHAASPEPGH